MINGLRQVISKLLQAIRLHQRFMVAICVATVSILAYCLIPKPDLYAQYSFSSVVYDKNGKVLKISLSMDDKYRLFVPYDKIPKTAEQALLLYEDRGFYYHFGVNPLSMIKAGAQMLAGHRKRGASTLTMQVARIVYHIDSSTIFGKIEQILRALQIERHYSKQEILETYFNLAPYGGNIEGIGAAALIYFGKPAAQLNLPQVLALTIIPQNPEKRTLLNNQGKQHNQTATKRLQQMWKQKYAHAENQYLDLPLVSGVYLPQAAPHLVRRVLQHNRGEIYVTLDYNLQRQAEETVKQYVDAHQKDGVYNAAVLIVDAQTMQTLAYVGAADFYNSAIQGQVDGVTALRSPGSALKPFIYALALEKGLIHPKTMLKDVPQNYGVYTPENFDHSFYGLVNATEALIYSRNIPAVDLLLKVGEKNMHGLLQKCGVHKLQTADFYGLALALGGAEVSMENLTAMYAMLYNGGKFENLHFLQNEAHTAKPLLSPEAAFLTLKMLTSNEATDFVSAGFANKRESYPVAWKTGTSYGFKDAWSVGVVGSLVVAVWVGNFDGTPNNAFVGREIAAPLFFRLVRKLSKKYKIPEKLREPEGLNLAKVKICKDTGDIADETCGDITETDFIPGVTQIKMSNVARLIPIDIETGLRACKHTPPTTQLKRYNFWSSDVLQAYAAAGINIRRPPEFKENCMAANTNVYGKAPQIILPLNGSKYLVHTKQKNQHKIALRAVAEADAKYIYWFINNKLFKQVKVNEVIEFTPQTGKTEIKAVDNLGRSAISKIYVEPMD